MKTYQIFEKETGKKHEVTRTFDCEEYETEVKIDVWNDDYVFWLQRQAEKLFAIPVVSVCQFETYAKFCIECDRKGIKPLKYKDYLEIG